MRIVLPGGSGQVGTLLARAFHAEGCDVVVLSRAPRPAPWKVAPWDPARPAGATPELDGADVVVNLAGRSVDCRYTPANRAEILRSRVASVRAVGEAIAAAARPPRVWLQASTATIYAHRYDGPNDEATGTLGGGEAGAPDTWRFSIEVAKAWERALDEAPTPRTRKVALRSAMVMSPDRGGIFDTLLTLVRRGLGGTSGDGRQYVSWIHEHDFVRAVRFLIDADLSGAVNLASPNPLPNREFMAALRHAWGAPVGLPATRWMLELGAFLLRTETELVLKSRRVVPGRLPAAGFAFEHPAWPAAAAELCARVRATSAARRRLRRAHGRASRGAQGEGPRPQGRDRRPAPRRGHRSRGHRCGGEWKRKTWSRIERERGRPARSCPSRSQLRCESVPSRSALGIPVLDPQAGGPAAFTPPSLRRSGRHARLQSRR